MLDYNSMETSVHLLLYIDNVSQIMVKVIMNFEVEDWDRWHTAFLANSKMRAENHIKEIYVGHELENKNKVHIVYDTPEPDTLQKMMQKPEVQEVMKNAGNKVETMVFATCTD